MMHDEGDYGRTAYDGDLRDKADWDARRGCEACNGHGKPGMYCNDSSDPERVQHCDGLRHPGDAFA